MGSLRNFLLTQRWLAFGLVALALAVRAAVPAGFMPGGAGKSAQILAISICADGSNSAAGSSAQGRQLLIPLKAGLSHNSPDSHDRQGQCAFSALSFAALGGADAALLAAALAFVLAVALAVTRPLRLARIAGLRPPLRGPPATA